MVGEYEENGSVTIARIGLDGSVRPITHDAAAFSYDRPYAGGGFQRREDGAVAFTVSPVDRPTDVAISTGGATRQLTDLNDLTLAPSAWRPSGRSTSARPTAATFPPG